MMAPTASASLGWLSFRFLGLAWGAAETTVVETTFLASTLASSPSCRVTELFAINVATCLRGVIALFADGAPDFLYLQIAFALVTLEAVPTCVLFVEDCMIFFLTTQVAEPPPGTTGAAA